MTKTNQKLTRWLINIALILLILLLFSTTRDFLKPIYSSIKFLIGPLILSVYFFYAFRPLRDWIARLTKRKTLAAALTFIIFLLVVILIFGFTFNMIYEQTSIFISNLDFKGTFDYNYEHSKLLNTLEEILPLQEMTSEFETWLENYLQDLPSQITSFVSNIGTYGSLLLLIILGLFYLLKDEEVVAKTLHKLSYGRYYSELSEMGHEIHNTLKTYISGQIMIALILGGCMFIGYKIISLPYAVPLALIASVMNFIPFIGPFLGALPAVLVGLTINFKMVLYVIILSVIVQQIEGNLVTPNIMGRKLDIHPFMVIVVVMISIRLFGILGALIASPLYITIKILIKGLRKIYYKSQNICLVPEEIIDNYIEKNYEEARQREIKEKQLDDNN